MRRLRPLFWDLTILCRSIMASSSTMTRKSTVMPRKDATFGCCSLARRAEGGRGRTRRGALATKKELEKGEEEGEKEGAREGAKESVWGDGWMEGRTGRTGPGTERAREREQEQGAANAHLADDSQDLNLPFERLQLVDGWRVVGGIRRVEVRIRKHDLEYHLLLGFHEYRLPHCSKRALTYSPSHLLVRACGNSQPVALERARFMPVAVRSAVG